MQKTNFSTTRLVCQPLEEKDICAFRQIVTEPHVQKFFHCGDPVDFLQGLEQYDCYPMGVYSATNSKLVGAHHSQKLGFFTLRFELEQDDEDIKHLLNMSFIPVHPIPEEYYTDEQSGKHIYVFKMVF